MPIRPSNPNPLLNASKCSRLFQQWVFPLVSKCRKQGTLDVNDLYEPLPDCETAALTDKLEANWFAEIKRNPNNPSLIRATLCTMRWKPFLIGLILIPSEFFNIIQPLLLTFLMRFFEPCSTMPAWHAWLLVMSTIFIAFCSSVIVNYAFFVTNTLALQMRVAYSGLIFRKLLRLSSHAFNSISSGEITNLLSNDATQIEMALFFINYLWTFLLLDESERDNRLLSRSHSELGYIEQNEPPIVKNNQTQSPKVICNLKRAQWEKV
ncbi:unnamed protein product [Rotaria sordida]|uniref:ABC transmembrane type-1 domain-containing protein n=1 Tax=Rotaria sordida TaxID=392033 RepID=A0A815LEB4_9BILA|nr:unnamed protein product [Rotaria sordida]